MGEILAVTFGGGVKMDMPARGHRYISRLKRKPLSAFDRNLCIVNGIAKHFTGEFNLTLGKETDAASRASPRGVHITAQRSSPAALIGAGNDFSPLVPNLSVTVVVPPAFSSADGSIAIT